MPVFMLCSCLVLGFLRGVGAGFFSSSRFSFSVPVKHGEPVPSSVFYNSLTLVCESPEQGSNTVN